MTLLLGLLRFLLLDPIQHGPGRVAVEAEIHRSTLPLVVTPASSSNEHLLVAEVSHVEEQLNKILSTTQW